MTKIGTVITKTKIAKGIGTEIESARNADVTKDITDLDLTHVPDQILARESTKIVIAIETTIGTVTAIAVTGKEKEKSSVKDVQVQGTTAMINTTTALEMAIVLQTPA